MPFGYQRRNSPLTSVVLADGLSESIVDDLREEGILDVVS